MRVTRWGTLLSLAASLAACGGGGGGSSSGSSGPIASVPPPPPPPTSSGCTLRARQDFAAAALREWYLFPETLPASLDPTPYSTVGDYVDALTATARAQGRDRFFTFATTIAEDDAFFSSGSTAGFGTRLALDPSGRLFVTESFEGAPFLAAGIDRGAEIVAIGTSTADLRTVSSIYAASGAQGLNDALGPSTPGVTRVFRISDSAGTRTVTVTKTNFDIPPVSSRYGAKIINEGGRSVGYVNLRTFVSSAEQPLRNAFASFRAQGITNVIVDLRYNGGGLISIAELLDDLLGGNRTSADVQYFQTFRPEKSQFNTTATFAPQPQSVPSMRIAFIGTSGTASASELSINAFLPYLHSADGLIGTNTFGKPVGQVGIDNTACGDRLRIIAFSIQNAAHQGDYFNGLASKMEATCQAGDDIFHPMGDPLEASTRSALDFLAGKTCTPIAGGGITTEAVHEGRQLLTAPQARTAQREVPGSF
jgi:carboxyl-terminal processing protease